MRHVRVVYICVHEGKCRCVHLSTFRLHTSRQKLKKIIIMEWIHLLSTRKFYFLIYVENTCFELAYKKNYLVHKENIMLCIQCSQYTVLHTYIDMRNWWHVEVLVFRI